MKVRGFWFFFVALGTFFMFPGFGFSFSNGGQFVADVVPPGLQVSIPVPVTMKTKENEPKWNRRLGDVYLEDYHRFDPAPSSKAAIKTGPIEHGTPLIPYIPKPTPPGHPKHAGSPP
ncbi:hypothetical protein AMTRI_Chr12g238330 [Amborella trichopoda]|uniref:uncharacterized protein LOC105420090 n=1 Tax=Amborella trichopoda TaxID=13333 RepID=UPI0005D3D19B|nr:uncharacterized protein LOC105420090 [Amborella trichopoda]|eukprot:XP_011620643.1 uncharacterized protein LOC105420090 [Amborella trichopoda]